MDLWEQNEQDADTWDSFPSYPVPTMQNAVHPVTTKVLLGYDGAASWFKYSGAVEEWCDLTKVEAKLLCPAIAARLSGRAELFKERPDRDRLKDAETCVDYLLSTLRPGTVNLSFSTDSTDMPHCNRGQTDLRHWMVKYEIARQKPVGTLFS